MDFCGIKKGLAFKQIMLTHKTLLLPHSQWRVFECEATFKMRSGLKFLFFRRLTFITPFIIIKILSSEGEAEAEEVVAVRRADV